jgi:DNA (cytosine-5)-methyltransferase 1
MAKNNNLKWLPNVLVGTYRIKCRKWILESNLYNYPISEGEPLNRPYQKGIKQIWLYHKNAAPLKFAAKFLKVIDLAGLAKLNYPKAAKPRAKYYSLYKLSPLKKTGETPLCVIQVSDFAKCERDKVRAVKFFSTPKDKRKKADRKALASVYPAEILDIGVEQLRVYENWDQTLFPKMYECPFEKAQRPFHTFVDLFAGCGGLSLGLEEAGFTPVLVNEINADAMQTYLVNRLDEFPWLGKNNIANIKDLVLQPDRLEAFRNNIKKGLGLDIKNGDLDLICGGPPCQGYSGIGIRRSYSVEKKQLPSNYLYQDMAFIISCLRPKIFLFENVRGLLSARWTRAGKKGEIFEDVLATFKAIGAYHICFKLVHAKDYGVPQNRPRVLIVGLRHDVFPDFAGRDDEDAVKTGFLPNPVGGYPTIPELLGDLLDPSYKPGGETLRYPSAPQNDFQKSLRTRLDGTIMAAGDPLAEMEYSNHSDFITRKFTAMINNGGIIPDEFKTKKFAQKVLPLKWDKDGPSITACSAPDDYVHYCQPRTLTVREWARLQMFPDWYKFMGKRTTGGLRRAGNPREGNFDRELPKYTQIGNAVPVGLAYNVGKHFAKLLEGR